VRPTPTLSSPPVRTAPDRSPEIASDRLTDGGLILLTLIWGANFSVVKWGLDFLTPLAFNALRFPVGCLVLGAAALSIGPLPRPGRADLPRLILLGLLGNGVYQLLFIYGLDLTRAGNAALLLATIPVWTLLFSALAREGTLDGRVFAGIAATFAGMLLVVAGGAQEVALGTGSLRGDIFMVLAAMSWAGYTVGSRPLIVRYGAIPVTAWTLWIGAAGLVLIGVPDLIATDWAAVPLGAWASVAFAGLLGLGLAYLIWYRAVLQLGSARTAAYSNLIPVVALIIAWILLGEVPTPLQVGGAAIILAGIVLARRGVGRRGPGTVAPDAGTVSAPVGTPADPEWGSR
jgi:drug/metabolite transporter (DMT)-like permease